MKTQSPPRDREVWQRIDQYAQHRAQHPLPTPPATKPVNAWVVCLVAILVCLGVALLNRPKPSPRVTPSIVAATPVPTPPITPTSTPVPAIQQAERHTASVTIAPRAELVTGPLTTTGVLMQSGNQYTLSMPDGRQILVTWKGWVDHASNLPRQPKGGANNAAYTEAATGHTWIWTVPAGTSNIPQWIDP